MKKGLFITFEGTEGCGKSTQVALLADHLSKLGHHIIFSHEPGGTPIGDALRDLLKHDRRNVEMKAETELLLMNASRAQLVREIIRPALSNGQIVLCDRFYDSTIAYQGYGRQLDLQMVRAIIDVAVGDTRPDLTLLLQVPAHVSAERLRARQATMSFVRDRIEEADRSFFERVAQGYDALATAEPKRVRRVDASGTSEAIAAAIWSLVQVPLGTTG